MRLTFEQVQRAGQILGICVDRSAPRRHGKYEAWVEGDSSCIAVAFTVNELWQEVWHMAPQSRREKYGLEVLDPKTYARWTEERRAEQLSKQLGDGSF